MAGKVLNKMMGFLGLDDDFEDDDHEDQDIQDNRNSEAEQKVSNFKKKPNVVSIHTTISAKVKIVKPTDYEEAADICDDVKNRNIVVINTTALEQRTAQRLLDFLGGSSYALGGTLEEIDKGVFLISPSNVEVSSDLKTELSTKGLFTWNK
ncbi:MAG TPA: cell division protein SepF [Clostridiaceae bacterium]|nr:cell division protein SepF [Clostridiaceae bacterium]